ncbi:MAG: hypothetical protein HY696_08615 [Deltaproteobacteria bacterium]|nr:hypothetical protein [Deltaproteobacteria bacterium]
MTGWRGWLIVMLLHSMPLGCFAGTAGPVVPRSGRSAQDFVPSGWTLERQLTDDLNRDGRPDFALLLSPADQQIDRLLVVGFGDAGGGFKLSAVKADLVMCQSCGGMLGDPLTDFRLERGVVVIQLYGGSRDRWGMTYRFRWQQNDWYLIGYTDEIGDTLLGTARTIDINWTTGAVITTETKLEQQTVTRATRRMAPITLSAATMERVRQAAGIDH